MVELSKVFLYCGPIMNAFSFEVVILTEEVYAACLGCKNKDSPLLDEN